VYHGRALDEADHLVIEVTQDFCGIGDGGSTGSGWDKVAEFRDGGDYVLVSEWFGSEEGERAGSASGEVLFGFPT